MDNREIYIIDRADLLKKSYNLLCLFFANKEISRRSDPTDENAPLSSLDKMFFVRESSRLLIEVAILIRVIDDQMKLADKNDSEVIRYHTAKKRVDNYQYGLFDDLNLNLRETCNKIIHSEVMEPHSSGGREAHEYDVAYLHGDGERTIDWKHFNGYVRLCGRKDGEFWYVLLNIEVFVSAIYELFQGNT